MALSLETCIIIIICIGILERKLLLKENLLNFVLLTANCLNLLTGVWGDQNLLNIRIFQLRVSFLTFLILHPTFLQCCGAAWSRFFCWSEPGADPSRSEPESVPGPWPSGGGAAQKSGGSATLPSCKLFNDYKSIWSQLLLVT